MQTSQRRAALTIQEIPGPHEPPSITRADDRTHYSWGDGCDGWRLVETPGLRVREECILPGRAECPHLHPVAQQAFYVLSGALTVHVPSEVYRLDNGDLLQIPAGVAHEVRNESRDPVRFLVMTVPALEDDREETGSLSSETARRADELRC